MLSIQLSRNYIRKKNPQNYQSKLFILLPLFYWLRIRNAGLVWFQKCKLPSKVSVNYVILNLFHCQTRLSSSSTARWRPGMKVNSFFWILPFLLFRGRVPKIFEKLSPFFEGDLQILLVTLILRCLLSDVFFTWLLPVGRKQSSSVLDCRLNTSLAGSSKTLDW